MNKKYIDRLKEIANDELEFQRVLLDIKDEIQLTKAQTREIKSLMNSCTEYCKGRIDKQMDPNKYIHVLSGHDFCIFILERLLTKKNDLYKTKRAFEKYMFGVSTLPREVSNELNTQFQEEVFKTFQIEYSEEMNYWFGRQSYEYGVYVIKYILRNLDFKYVYKLTGVKPIVFVGNEGGRDFYINKLSIMGVVLSEEDLDSGHSLSDKDIVGFIINNAMRIVFEELLEEYDLEMLSERFDIPRENIKLQIKRELHNLVIQSSKEPSYMFTVLIGIAEAKRMLKSKLNKYQQCYKSSNG